MPLRGWIAGFTLVAALVSVPVNVAALETLHSTCAISVGEKTGMLRLRMGDEGCKGGRDCSNFSSDDLTSRITGLTLADLARDGAELTAGLSAEAGTFTCAGTVHGGELEGKSTFTPNEQFVERMRQLGLTGFNSEKLEAYTLFDIKTSWVQSLQGAKVKGIAIDNLIALKIFRVDAAYVAGITALGFETPDADKLVALKVQGVNADEVRQIRALGLQPTIDELIQMRIFHVTPEFVKSMQARGFHDLTISKLVQIKIFKIDE
jgi:hypothetical protein